VEGCGCAANGVETDTRIMNVRIANFMEQR
jgi:hypothetical protein